ncbi:hypothetical protein [Yersinia alsatica]|nr:hypothetical protein [Yersinia alsatica]
MTELPQSICVYCFLMLNKGETYAHQKFIDKAAKEAADDNRQAEE